jgi:hypothetical protein
MLTLPLFPGFTIKPARSQQAERAKPASVTTGPVFIHDCISGVNHTTVLHELWRRAEKQTPER